MALTDITTRSTTLTAAARHPFSLRTLLSVWKSRRALAQLDDRALDDIGVNARQAARESAKPIWDVPATWRT
ncbi:DUF1127 domain-containing protein [Tateyamaria sp. syn59]|uniref:DUF1127 domain-containing protein n=1 Tax=Tateyamaria sp. syn59 TaxID=2576942 RepID=UPI0011BEA12C|nr:DUF1127 domain-containing protein [Tateyamaria sp. syn59]